MDSMNPMGMILAGQNGLWDKLKMWHCEATSQQIDSKCEILQYDWYRTEEYVEVQLSYAEEQPDIFTNKTQ